MSWEAGTRCGIDNCPSRFYRVLEGSRVCQNGHVHEGWETAGDDDDFAAHGRRIRRPGQAARSETPRASLESEKLAGIAGRLLFYECLQDLLREQIRWLSEKLGHDRSHIEAAARPFWACWIDTSPSSEILASLSSIAYLSCVAVRLPIFIVDLVQWIGTWEFPYMECIRFIDSAKLRRLPDTFVYVFRPRRPPTNSQFPLLIPRLVRMIGTTLKYRFPQPPWRLLVFKIVRALLLPPAVYGAAIRILMKTEYDLELSPKDMGSSRVRRYFPETEVVCAVCVAAKLGYGLDCTERRTRPQDPDEEIWRDLVRKLWLLKPEHATADERTAIWWSPDRIDAYLDWYTFHFGREIPDPRLPQRRLQSIFSSDSSPESPPLGAEVPDELSLTELGALLYSVAPSDIPGRPGPGADYKIWSNDSVQHEAVLPESTQVLYDVAASLLGSPSDEIRARVRELERTLRQCGKNIYSELSKSDAALFLPARDLNAGSKSKSQSLSSDSSSGASDVECE